MTDCPVCGNLIVPGETHTSYKGGKCEVMKTYAVYRMGQLGPTN